MTARHMRMAALTGHFTARHCDQAMDLFERGKPISGELWAQVNQEYAQAFSAYDLALCGVAINGGEPIRGWRSARHGPPGWGGVCGTTPARKAAPIFCMRPGWRGRR